MGTGSFIKSDLPALYGYSQLSMLSYPKQLFIEQLREFFSQDTYYVYNRDVWGFNKIPDHTDLDPLAGIHDSSTTRLYIGEAFRYDVIYYPALLVKSGGMKAVPISFNREKESVQWTTVVYEDGYGHQTIKSTPSHIIHAGAYEGQIVVDILTRSLRARDELGELISILFVDKAVEDMERAGVFVKPNGITIGSPSETDDRNDKLLKLSISFDIRTEWRRHIPVENILDIINICVEIGSRIDTDTPLIAPNLTISTNLELIDGILNLG